MRTSSLYRAFDGRPVVCDLGIFEAIDTIVAALMKALGDTALLPLLPRLRLVGTIRLGCVVSSGLSAFPVEREQGIRSCEVPVYFTGGSRL